MEKSWNLFSVAIGIPNYLDPDKLYQNSVHLELYSFQHVE